jgi:DNA-binding transcriptional regulator YdaS (Cro superfamily)
LCDILYLPVVFNLLDHVKTRNLSDLVHKLADWERFQSLACELISLRIQINSWEEADKEAHDFTMFFPGLQNLLRHKRRLRNVWQVTRYPVRKTAVNWIAKTIRRITPRKALERWETKVGNCEITPEVLWPIAKSLMKRDELKAPTFRNDVLPERKRQNHCELSRKPVHIS